MMRMQAVAGRIQLKRTPEWAACRQVHVAKLAESLGKFASIHLIRVVDYIRRTQHRPYTFVKPEHPKEGWMHDRTVNELNARKVSCCRGSCSEVCLEKTFDDAP